MAGAVAAVHGCLAGAGRGKGPPAAVPEAGGRAVAAGPSALVDYLRLGRCGVAQAHHGMRHRCCLQVCNDVLHNRDVGLEAHYFCAQTLRTKVRAWLGGWRAGGGLWPRVAAAEQPSSCRGLSKGVAPRPGAGCCGRERPLTCMPYERRRGSVDCGSLPPALVPAPAPLTPCRPPAAPRRSSATLRSCRLRRCPACATRWWRCWWPLARAPRPCAHSCAWRSRRWRRTCPRCTGAPPASWAGSRSG